MKWTDKNKHHLDKLRLMADIQNLKRELRKNKSKCLKRELGEKKRKLRALNARKD